jgi:hypothetical protein
VNSIFFTRNHISQADSMSNAPLVPLTGTPGNAAPLPLIDEMDLSIQCNPAFLRSTVSKIVNSQAAATNSRLPLGLVCKPMAGDVGTDNDGECLSHAYSLDGVAASSWALLGGLPVLLCCFLCISTCLYTCDVDTTLQRSRWWTSARRASCAASGAAPTSTRTSPGPTTGADGGTLRAVP